jgi:hypothetical protein
MPVILGARSALRRPTPARYVTMVRTEDGDEKANHRVLGFLLM